MFHLLRFPVRCKQTQNATPRSCYYLVCLSRIRSCYDHAGAVSASVSMLPNRTRASTFLEKWKCSKVHLSRQALKRVHENWSGSLEKLPAHTEERFAADGTQGLGHGVDLSCACEACYLQDVYLVLLSATTMGPWLRNKNNTTSVQFQSVSESLGSRQCYCPRGNLNGVYAHRIVTLTLKPQTWIESVVKHRYM